MTFKVQRKEQIEKRYFIKWAILIIVLLIGSLFSIFVGVSELSPSHLFQTESIEWKVLVTTRVPRTISIVIAGATLSLSGLLMQQLTQNKFTSPSTVGTMQSARLGLILSLLFFPKASIFNRALFSFGFAIIGTFIFLGLLRVIRANHSIFVPIVGIMLGNIISSLGTYFSLQWDIVQSVNAWLQGSFSLIHSANYQLIFVSLLSMLGMIIGAHYFSIVGLGENIAIQLGAAYERILLIGILFISLGTAVVLLTVGNIPFIGLVVPNLISLHKGDYFRRNIMDVTVYGAVFLLISDILARVIIYPYEIPVSVIVGIIGSALFIYLLLKGEWHDK